MSISTCSAYFQFFDSASGVSSLGNTTLRMVCDKCLILLKELPVPITSALAVNAPSLSKRKTNLLKRLEYITYSHFLSRVNWKYEFFTYLVELG